MIDVQRGELYSSDYVIYEFIGQCSDICELISFILDVMLGTTKLSSLILVSVTLTFTQGHMVT